MEEEDQNEMQLLPSPPKYRSMVSDQFEGMTPSLDLQLSISVRPIHHQIRPLCNYSDVNKSDTSCVEALKWQAAEQIRLAGIEKAYADRVRELTKREIELAQSEFTRARQMGERAREEVEKAERTKERATRKVDSMCMEITCQSCRQTFRP